mgnify:CR=1 FL=1
MTPTVTLAWLPEADQSLPLPAYQTAGAAGADVCANFPPERRDGITLAPGARALLPTGLRMAIPAGFEVQVRPRSGLALKHGVTVANPPGTIDSDYRGPLGVILVNLGAEPFHHGAPFTSKPAERKMAAAASPCNHVRRLAAASGAVLSAVIAAG